MKNVHKYRAYVYLSILFVSPVRNSGITFVTFIFYISCGEGSKILEFKNPAGQSTENSEEKKNGSFK